MKNTALKAIVLIIVIMLTTMVVKVPLPTRGYFNFGDVAVIFAGLVLGAKLNAKGKRECLKNGIWLAFLVGGIGSGLADILSGFAFFAPMTFLAKGLEAAWAAYASSRQAFWHLLALLLGGSMMVLTYLFLEAISPSIGLQGALAEILPNCIQAAGGIVGGKLIYLALLNIEKKS